MEAIKLFNYPMFNCAKFKSQWDQKNCYKLKKKQILLLYKQNKNLKLFIKCCINSSNNAPRSKCLKPKPLLKLNYSSTGLDLCLQRLSCKLTENRFKK